MELTQWLAEECKNKIYSMSDGDKENEGPWEVLAMTLQVLNEVTRKDFPKKGDS
jgi:hypothetical protein